MSKDLTRRREIHFTDRALLDLQAIEAYSVAAFGRKTANEYLNDFEAAAHLLQENPNLLRREPAASASFLVYRVRKHLMICELLPDAIFVMTIIHGSMDVPNRLLELEPTLAEESKLLSQRLIERRQR